MASNVQICNLALLKIGDITITSLTDDTKSARVCNQIFEPIRDAVLREHHWNFAIKREELGLMTSSPAFEYSNQFQLPSDCLKVIEVEDHYEHKIEGGKLLTNESSIFLKYIARIEDPNLYDSLFIEALSARLAAELAIAIADNNTLHQNMVVLYDEKISMARSLDAKEGTPEGLETTNWLFSRY